MIHTFNVAATLAAYRCVAPASTAYQVGYPASAQVLPIGITKDTVKDTINSIPVAGPGERAMLTFNETMASGGLVGSDTNGFGTPRTVGALTTTAFTSTAAYVGVLIGPAVAVTGTVAEVYICPGFVRGT